MTRSLSLLALVVAVPLAPAADDVPLNKQFQTFVLKQAAELRKNDKAPATLAEWNAQAETLRKNLFAAWGGDACFLPKPCDLDPQQHGEPLKRDGYTVEKLTIQPRPGVRMTCNLYVPDGAKKKPAPAILQVHGHWKARSKTRPCRPVASGPRSSGSSCCAWTRSGPASAAWAPLSANTTAT